jgi:hypothetical protein
MKVMFNLEQVLGTAEKTRTAWTELLTGCKTKDEQQSSWARQRQKKPGRSPLKRPKKWTGVRRSGQGWLATLPDMKVMFNQNRPDTTIQHSVAERAMPRVTCQ